MNQMRQLVAVSMQHLIGLLGGFWQVNCKQIWQMKPWKTRLASFSRKLATNSRRSRGNWHLNSTRYGSLINLNNIRQYVYRSLLPNLGISLKESAVVTRLVRLSAQICQHMKANGKESTLPFNIISRFDSVLLSRFSFPLVHSTVYEFQFSNSAE